MSSIKNGYYEACEKLASGISSLSKGAVSCAERALIEARNGRMESAEELCLTYAMSDPDGNPLKGKEAVLASDIMIKALRDEDWELLNKLKELGFIHK
jgi:hypothetical protein